MAENDIQFEKEPKTPFDRGVDSLVKDGWDAGVSQTVSKLFKNSLEVTAANLEGFYSSERKQKMSKLGEMPSVDITNFTNEVSNKYVEIFTRKLAQRLLESYPDYTLNDIYTLIDPFMPILKDHVDDLLKGIEY